MMIERLEDRRLLVATPVDTDAGNLGFAPDIATGTVSLDPSGEEHNRLIAFRTTRPMNAHFGATITGAEVDVEVFEDNNGNRVLEDEERQFSLDPVLYFQPGTSSGAIYDLRVSNYIAEVSVGIFELPPATLVADYRFEISGRSASIRLTYNGVSLPIEAGSPSEAEGTDFGGVLQGSTPPAHVFTVTNTGNDNLTVEDSSFENNGVLDGAFEVTYDNLNVHDVLSPGEQGRINVFLLTGLPGLKIDETAVKFGGTGEELAILRLSLRGFVSPTGDNLGTLSPTPLRTAGRVEISSFSDTSGNYTGNHKTKTVRFTLDSPLNNLTIAPRVEAGDAPVSFVVAPDTNPDGILDVAEFNSAVLQQFVNGNNVRRTFPKNGLAHGAYFAHFFVDPQAPGGDATLVADFDADLSAVPGGSPAIRVTGLSDAEIADGDTTPLASDGTEFGPGVLGQPGPTREFKVTNTGTADLMLGAVDVDGGGFQIESGLPAKLTPGASGTFSVKLLTDTVGSKSATIRFSTKISGKDPFNFNVNGVVNEPVSEPPPPEPNPDPPPPDPDPPLPPPLPEPPPPPPVGISATSGGLPPSVLAGSRTARGMLSVAVRDDGGAGFNGPVTVSAVASADTAAGSGDDPLGSITKNVKLAAGSQKVLKLKLQVPASATAGTRNLIVTIANDSKSATQAAGTFTIDPAIVRLRGQVSSGGSQKPIAFGKRASLVIPLQNVGTVPTTRKPAGYTLIVTGDGTEAGKLFETTTSGRLSLKPNAAKSQKAGATFPAGAFAPGTYTLLVKINAELNDRNGEVVVQLPVTFVG